MKIAFIGDTHGRQHWKKVNVDEYDKVVFIGDYVDSFDITLVEQLDNLNDLIKLRDDYEDKIVFLAGNHDISYLWDFIPYSKCSGYQHVMQFQYKELLTRLNTVGSFAYKNVLATHAGVNKKWCDKYGWEELHQSMTDGDCEKASELINDMYLRNDRSLLDPGTSGTMGHLTGSFIWARPQELTQHQYERCVQVVGHTPQTNIINHSAVYYIDVLEYGDKEILVMEDKDDGIDFTILPL